MNKAEDKLAKGTTSAYAENTKPFSVHNPPTVNYLRVRGEYTIRLVFQAPPMELPPRTRRIHAFIIAGEGVGGTTSAYAENTLNELGLL